MTYLFFDTETTGLPDFKQPVSWEGQPRICQIGAILTDREGAIKAEMNLLVAPAGWEIPAAATGIHGISQEDAKKYGLSIRGVMSIFNRLICKAEMVIAHNISFDRFMVRREAVACEFPESDFSFKEFCTMQSATNITKLPPSQRMVECGMTSFKSPSLQELYTHFFGKPFEGAHDAMADVRACKDVFFKIQEAKKEAA